MACKDDCMRMMEEMKEKNMKDSMSKMMQGCDCSMDFKDMMENFMETSAETKEK